MLVNRSKGGDVLSIPSGALPDMLTLTRVAGQARPAFGTPGQLPPALQMQRLPPTNLTEDDVVLTIPGRAMQASTVSIGTLPLVCLAAHERSFNGGHNSFIVKRLRP